MCAQRLRHFGTLRWEIGSAKHGSRTEIRRAQKQIMPLAGAETKKPDLYAVASCTKARPYDASPRYRTAAKDISDPLERFSPCVRVATRRRQFVSCRYGYFFFFEVFFATFLVAAFAVFFAFFAFLAMSSSIKNWLSEHAHAVDRHAQH